MWNWNQFKNLPRNRDLSPQEQSRQYFIYQSNMMYEASVNNTVAAAAAAAGAGAGGGGIRKPKKIVASIYDFCDFLTDTKHKPSQSELLNYNSLDQEDNYNGPYRLYRDTFLKATSEYNIQFIEYGGYSVDPTTKPIPNFPVGSVFYKGPVSDTNYTIWQFSSLIDEPETFYPQPDPPNEQDGSNVIATWGDKDNLINLWEQDNFDVLLPGVENINFLPAITDILELPTIGNPGDIIALRTGNTVDEWYAWDPTLNIFSTTFYDELDNNVLFTMRIRRDAHAKATNELRLANSPFIWAGLYIPEYRIVKDLL
jgi:hypothetical protein